MICNDCHKSFDGAGMRCIRCNDLFLRGGKNKEEAVRLVISASKEFKRCTWIIYGGAAFTAFWLLVSISLWFYLNRPTTMITNQMMLEAKNQLNPISLLVQALLVIGIACKSRLASTLQFLFYLLSLVYLSGNASFRDQIANPVPIIMGIVYLATTYCCYRWHTLRRRLRTA